MKPKTMILLAVALTCGLGASYMTSKLLAERKGPAPEERVSILVAKLPVPKYTILNEPEKYFEIKSRLKTESPGSYFSDLREIKDKRVNKEFKAEVHISPEDVIDKMNGLPIPEGYGSIGLPVTSKSAVSFFVNPGDKVDIILTQKGEQANSRTILNDVLVLSVGDQLSKTGASPSGVIQAQTVNVAVKSDQAQLIRLAEGEGELSLFLRRDGEKGGDNRNEKVTTREDLKRLQNPGLNLPTEKPTPPAATTESTKLPFGLTLDDVEKAAKKTDPTKEVTPEPVKPAWTIVVELGANAKRRVDFYKKPDGSITRGDDPTLEGLKPEKVENKPLR